MCYELKGMIIIKYPKDLTGMKFGELTVLRKAEGCASNGGALWICRCSCGNETIVSRSHLTSGHTRSCGCLKKGKHAEDLTGKTFGRLTVLERAEDHISHCGHKEIMWKCRCECGNEVIVRGQSLRSGVTRSCGCLKRELTSERTKVHGRHGERLYYIWCNIIQRCCNKNNQFYHYYGGRGIKICDEWRNDYIAFKEWALSTGYDESAPRGECTIDRIDVDGDYDPDNCRWANAKEQVRNRRNTLKFTYNEEEKSLKEWCEESDLSYDTVYHRLKLGWTFEEALGF